MSRPVVPLTMSNDTIRSLPSVSVKLGAVNFATGATSLSLTVSIKTFGLTEVPAPASV